MRLSSPLDPETLEAFANSADELLGSTDQRSRRRGFRKTGAALDRSTWSAFAEAGWLSIPIAEDVGGLGLGIAYATAVARSVGRHLAPEPFASAGVRPGVLLNEMPPSPRRDELIARFMSGESLIGVAAQEFAGIQAVHEAATLEPAEGGWALTGLRRFVEPGASADGWLVRASIEGLAAVLWVPSSARGVTVHDERRVDEGLWGTVEFLKVEIPAHDVLATGSAAESALDMADDGARLAQAAELLGIAERTRDITLDYLRLRKQFGKPIGSFQALQHRMVDAQLQIELASAALNDGLNADWTGPQADERAATASRVKSRCADSAIHVSRLAIQLHGAMGYTDECDVGLYFKRALALNAALGSAQAHRKRFFQLSRKVSTTPATALSGEDRTYPADTNWEDLSDVEFRAAVRSFLVRHYPKELLNLPFDAHWHQVEDWYGKLYRQGWVAPAWPREHGGMGLSPSKLVAFFEEMSNFGVARFISNGVQMLGPLLMKFGSAAQRETYLPKILTNEHRWAQGYSEPNAGSDLASLNMQAVVDGDTIVLNGRKIWTSHALECNHIFVLVRTAKTARAGDGISFVLVDLATPGIEVRGILNVGLDTTFAEVTFDDVRVPLSNLVGELNQGWTLAKALLGHERLFSGEPSPSLRLLHQLTVLAQERGLFDDEGFAERYTQLRLDVLDLAALYNRFAEVVKQGGQLGQDVSLLKICATETRQRAAALLCDSAAENGVNVQAQRIGNADLNLVTPLLVSLAASIAAGSNEVQRNIVARHVLNLP